MARKLFVRYSQSSDEQAIFDFYEKNQHAFVAKRDPEVWKERISSGAVTIIHDEDGTIVASSISYPLMKKNDKGEDVHAWTELGSTRVALEGIGLFNALISAQVMRAYLLEPPEDRFAIEIRLGNAHSKHVFLKIGGAPFDTPEALREKVDATMSPDELGDKVEWFQLGVEAMPGLAGTLLNLVKNPKLVNKKTGEEYELDFSRCVVTQKFTSEVQGLAASDFGDVKKPDPALGLKASRNGLRP